MRLHLNKTLRAALIAAIATVGFTLPQAEAEVSWNGGPKDSYGYTQVFYLNNGSTASLTDTDHNQFLITSNVNGANPATGEITSVVTKDGALMRISGGNNWGDDRILNPLTIDNVQAGGGTGTVNISTQPWNASRPAANTTVSILAVSGTVGSVENYGVLTLGASDSTINASGTLVNHEGATLTLNGSYSFDTSNATKYTLKQEGSATWTDPTNEQGFKKTSGSSYYIIKGATAGTNFQASTTTGATISEESTGTYYFTAGDVTDTTKFYVKKDAVTLEGVNGTGTFQVDKAGATVTVQNATYRVTTSNMNVNIVVNDGGVLETNHSGVNGFITGALTINAGGIMRIVGEHDAFGWGSKNQCVASLVMEGTSEKEARLELNQSTGNSATMVTDITMKGYSTITSTKQGGSAGFNTFGCAITAENVQNTIEVLDTRRNGVTITVADGGQLTVKKQTINGSDNSAATVVVKQGAGTLFYTGEAKAKGLNIQAGTVDFSGTAELQALTIGEAGMMKVSGGTTNVGGTSNVISSTIHVTAGTLNLNGTFAIDGNAGELTKSYGGGENLNNGFCTSSGFIVVYEVEEGGASVVIGQDAQITRGGVDVKAQLVNGVYTASEETDYTNFYVNTGTEKVSKAYSEHTPSTFTLAANTGLTVDQSVTATVTGSGDSSVVTIESDRVLTGTAQNVKIAGSGTYALTSGSTSIGANVSLDAGWSGTVRLGGFGFKDTDLAPFMNGSKTSWVEMNGITGGYLKAWNGGTEAANIRLTNPGDDGIAWVWSDGTSGSSDPTITFTGKWEGEGTFKLSNLRENITFAGDISEWNGTFDYHGNHGTTLTFKGGATEINATILNNGVNDAANTQKQFHLVVQNEASFAQDVAAYTLDVAEGASATFKGDATFNSLSGTGKVALDENSALTVSGTVAESVKIDAADGATIDADLDTTQVGIAANATASFVQGVADVASGVSFQNEGETPAPVTVENTSADEVLHYNIGAENAKVTADSLDAYTDQAVEVKNEVVVNSIYNMGAAVTLTNVDTDALSNIENYGDQVTLQNVGSEAIEIATISLYETTVAVYTDDTNTTEGTITITEAMNAGAGTLLSNLLLANGSMLNLAVSTQEGDHIQALTLGSQFGIEDGGVVNLDDLTIAALQDLAEGDSLDLVKAGQSQLTYFGEYNGKSYDDLFVRTEGMLGDYVVYARGDAFGLTKQGAVPEPTTGTLSLLALMALAARRRRK